MAGMPSRLGPPKRICRVGTLASSSKNPFFFTANAGTDQQRHVSRKRKENGRDLCGFKTETRGNIHKYIDHDYRLSSGNKKTACLGGFFLNIFYAL